jgi:ornithine cyclodeaminase
MRHITAENIHRLVSPADLVAPLREAFVKGISAPERAHHTVPNDGGADATLLLMPAWRPGGLLGVKVATVFPDNAQRSLPSVMAQYLLLSAVTGEPLALLDGRALTLVRTAAVSALAADYLARRESSVLLMVGTGELAPYLVEAHVAQHAIARVIVWGRDPAKAAALVAQLRGRFDCQIDASGNLEEAVSAADIISCATLSQAPLVRGAWLRPGTHLDLVGGFTPKMREADDAAMERSGAVVVDSATALSEAGDLMGPIQSGALDIGQVRTLADVISGKAPGRSGAAEITVFKSVGTALADLTAAEEVIKRA